MAATTDPVARNRAALAQRRACRLLPAERTQIVRIVDTLHADTSPLAAIRAVLGRMKPGVYRALPRPIRRQILQTIVRQQAANQRLYHNVQTGRI